MTGGIIRLGFSQSVDSDNTVRRVVTEKLQTSEIIQGFDNREYSVEGDYYLNPDWYEGFITLKNNQTFQQYPLKYDIFNDILEIKVKDEIKILKGEKIASFTWFNEARKEEIFYLNSHDYRLNGTPLIGFFELVADGKVQLLSKVEVAIKDPTYLQGLDMGKQYTEILKKEVYYLSDASKALKEIKNKKDLWEYLGNDAQHVKQHMRQAKLSVKKKQELAQIVSFINQIKVDNK